MLKIFNMYYFKHALACMIGVLLQIWDISHLVTLSVSWNVIVRWLVFFFFFSIGFTYCIQSRVACMISKGKYFCWKIQIFPNPYSLDFHDLGTIFFDDVLSLRRFLVLMKLSQKRQNYWVTQHLMQPWMHNFWCRLVFLLQYQW